MYLAIVIVLAVLVLGILIARVAGTASVPRLDSWAAAVRVGLAVMLLFNIHAARAGVTLRGQAATPLVGRIPMQLLFIGLTWWSTVSAQRRS